MDDANPVRITVGHDVLRRDRALGSRIRSPGYLIILGFRRRGRGDWSRLRSGRDDGGLLRIALRRAGCRCGGCGLLGRRGIGGGFRGCGIGRCLLGRGLGRRALRFLVPQHRRVKRLFFRLLTAGVIGLVPDEATDEATDHATDQGPRTRIFRQERPHPSANSRPTDRADSRLVDAAVSPLPRPGTRTPPASSRQGITA